MRKVIAATALAVLLGVATYQMADAGPGWRGACGGPGTAWCDNGGSNDGSADQATIEARQKFFEESATLRASLHAKRAEYRDLLAQGTVDKDKASALWSEIFDLQTELKQMAADNGMPASPGFSRGFGRGGCNGPGGAGFEGGTDAGPNEDGRGFMRQAWRGGRKL